MELAIDTSTGLTGIALSEKGCTRAELVWQAQMNQTVQTLGAVNNLLKLTGTVIEDVLLVAVALGPGSFAGVRVGLSIAKGLADSLGIPLTGASTLEIEALPFATLGVPIIAVHEIGRSELATATYGQNAGAWECLKPEHLEDSAQFVGNLAEKVVVCGELSSSLVDRIRISAPHAIVPPANQRLRRPAFLAQLAWERMASGRISGAETLQPIYLRAPHITVPKHRH